MTYATNTSPARSTIIDLPLAEVKPTLKRLGAMARLFLRLQGALPMNRRYRRDIGLDHADYDPRTEVADLMIRNGIHF